MLSLKCYQAFPLNHQSKCKVSSDQPSLWLAPAALQSSWKAVNSPKRIYLIRNPVAVWLAAMAQRLGAELAFVSALCLDKAMAVSCVRHVGLRELPLGLSVSKWCRAVGGTLQNWMSLRTSCRSLVPKLKRGPWAAHSWTSLWHLGYGQGRPWHLAVLLCSLPQQLFPG